MNPNMAQSLVSDHVRESRQLAAVARRAGAVRHEGRHGARKADTRAARRVHWLARGA